MAILPFTVPESFARPGDEAHHFGRRLAKNFQEEFLQRGTVQIVELFNRDNWPGKRDDFFSGNYQAIEYARNAGYDLVLTGHMDDITDAEQIVVYTKVIDVNNSVTIWSSRTTAYSRERSLKKELDRARIGTYQPSIFPFYEQGAELARCTVAEINESEEMVPE